MYTVERAIETLYSFNLIQWIERKGASPCFYKHSVNVYYIEPKLERKIFLGYMFIFQNFHNSPLHMQKSEV